MILLLHVKANQSRKGHKRTFLVLKVISNIIAENPCSCLRPGLWNLYAVTNHSVQVVVLCSFHGPFTMM